jgi:copper homeostasis protein
VIVLEACVDSVAAALAAEAAGADRVELCADLAQGGVTPSAGTISVAGERLAIPMHVMVLARGGGYLLSDDDLEVMRRDIAMARAARAAGIVVGALTPEGLVDREATTRLVAWARPMSITFHRAFDVVRDPFEALDALLQLGVDRVLTSGQGTTALEGAETIARLVAHAGPRLVVLAGGSIRAHNVEEIVRRTGVAEVHSRDITGMRAALAAG